MEDIVKKGATLYKQGESLNKIEGELYKHGVQDQRTLATAMQQIKTEGDKVKAEETNKKEETQVQQAQVQQHTQPSSESSGSKSSFGWIFILIAVVAIVVGYLFFSGTIDFSFLGNLI
ncbi:MAG TPA: hypothetical protein VI564_08345 [Candidatus Nanoarchaeia archaeon]|nr:hypothetical protein [Candidatus Nanoarchaeia archaeon]